MQKFFKCPRVAIYDIPGIEESELALSLSEFFRESMARVGVCLPWPSAIASSCAYFWRGEGITVPLLCCCTFNTPKITVI